MTRDKQILFNIALWYLIAMGFFAVLANSEPITLHIGCCAIRRLQQGIEEGQVEFGVFRALLAGMSMFAATLAALFKLGQWKEKWKTRKQHRSDKLWAEFGEWWGDRDGREPITYEAWRQFRRERRARWWRRLLTWR